MTCKEKLLKAIKEDPENVVNMLMNHPVICPEYFGYVFYNKPCYLSLLDNDCICRECWNREIPEE